jgi:dihydroceramidase
MLENRFWEPSPHSALEGFWEPHSSSIDFCEANYFRSHYIVEVHNTWSSLMGLSSFGLIGLVIGNHLKESRNTVAYSVLILIGLGSAGLHGTLHWFLQSADEVPMMYLLLSIFYLCGEYDAPVGKPNYPHLPQFLIFLAVANTLLYYCFQQLYLVFLCTFFSEAAVAIAGLRRIIYGTEGRSAIAKRINNIGVSSLFLVALPSWLYDMLQCKKFIGFANGNLFGMTPHIVWHFGAGFAAYCAIVCLECCRMEELKVTYKARFIGGIFPVAKKIHLM